MARSPSTQLALAMHERLPRTAPLHALLNTTPAGDADMARGISHAVVEGWWKALATGRRSRLGPTTCPLPLPDLEPEKAACARAAGARLAALPIPEAVSQIGQIYSHSLPSAHRSDHGIFYTPPALVGRLLDRATDQGVYWARARVISPSCGAGAFLVEDALRMADAISHSDPAIVVASIGARLRGWDQDPFACWLSQVVTEAAILPFVVASGRRLPPITECRDSLLDEWGANVGAYDLVNDNPAFGKVKKNNTLAKRFSRGLRGHINSYGLFLDLAIHLARPLGGVIAYLTPTSYLSGDYFARLRGLVVREAPPVSIDLVESRSDVFPDVLQEVALSVFVRGSAPGEATCSRVRVEPSALRVEDVGELELPNDPEGPWFIARDPASVPLIAAMRKMPARLATWGYRVKTGPLVPHKNKERMHAKPSAGRVPVVWAESISSTGGHFQVRCDRTGRKAWYQPRSVKDPNVSTSAAFLLQRTTAKEQSRRLIGAVMSSAAIKTAGGRVAVENHVNMIVPTQMKPPVAPRDLAAFFASDAADRAFRCLSGSVAVSAAELEALPVPTAYDLLAALSSTDSEAALRRLYGIEDGQTSHATDADKAD